MANIHISWGLMLILMASCNDWDADKVIGIYQTESQANVELKKLNKCTHISGYLTPVGPHPSLPEPVTLWQATVDDCKVFRHHRMTIPSFEELEIGTSRIGPNKWLIRSYCWLELEAEIEKILLGERNADLYDVG